MLMSQNIFDYATSELSQDAFICLIVSGFDSGNPTLESISKSFVSELYNKYSKEYSEDYPSDCFAENICEIETIELHRQYLSIDVYFKVTCKDGNTIHFIIEDKTWTEPHSNQLPEYVAKIKNRSKSCKIVKILFKTGHITEEDRCKTKLAKYTIIDISWIYNFLKHETFDDTCNACIYNLYKDFIKKTFYDKFYNRDGQEIQICDRSCNDLKYGYVQYKILERIKTKIEPDECKTPYIKHNRNGTNWETQWAYASKSDDSILIKISKRKDPSTGQYKYCLRLVQYQKDVNSINQSHKIARLKDYKEIAKNIKPSKYIIGTTNGKHQESDIIKVFFDCNETTTLCNIIDDFIVFAEDFKSKL